MEFGKIVYQILRRPADDTVIVEALRYECTDSEYAGRSYKLER